MSDGVVPAVQESALSSPDADAREAALEALCDSIEAGDLDDRLSVLGERMLAALLVGLGSEDDDAVFGRSFSVLVLGACVARVRARWLGAAGAAARLEEHRTAGAGSSLGQVSAPLPDMLIAWCARFNRWFAEERDVRGYVSGRGWAHAVAHGADAWGEFARSLWPIAGVRAELLDAVVARAMAPTAPWMSGEADRLALAVCSVPDAAAEIVARLNRAMLDAQADAVDPCSVSFNAEQLLRALALQVAPGSAVDLAVRRGVGERYPYLGVFSESG